MAAGTDMKEAAAMAEADTALARTARSQRIGMTEIVLCLDADAPGCRGTITLIEAAVTAAYARRIAERGLRGLPAFSA